MLRRHQPAALFSVSLLHPPILSSSQLTLSIAAIQSLSHSIGLFCFKSRVTSLWLCRPLFWLAPPSPDHPLTSHHHPFVSLLGFTLSCYRLHYNSFFASLLLFGLFTSLSLSRLGIIDQYWFYLSILQITHYGYRRVDSLSARYSGYRTIGHSQIKFKVCVYPFRRLSYSLSISRRRLLLLIRSVFNFWLPSLSRATGDTVEIEH